MKRVRAAKATKFFKLDFLLHLFLVLAAPVRGLFALAAEELYQSVLRHSSRLYATYAERSIFRNHSDRPAGG